MRKANNLVTDKNRIGRLLTNDQELETAVKGKRSIVVTSYSTPLRMPASVLINYPYKVVKKMLKDKVIYLYIPKKK